MVEKNGRVRKLAEMIAGLRHGTVGGGSSLPQPFKGRHLRAAFQNAAGGSEVIRGCAGKKFDSMEFFHPLNAGEIGNRSGECLVYRRGLLENSHAAPGESFCTDVAGRTHIARGILRTYQID